METERVEWLLRDYWGLSVDYYWPTALMMKLHGYKIAFNPFLCFPHKEIFLKPAESYLTVKLRQLKSIHRYEYRFVILIIQVHRRGLVPWELKPPPNFWMVNCKDFKLYILEGVLMVLKLPWFFLMFSKCF